MSTPPRTLVVIPTYNELLNLSPILERTLTANPDVDVLVVDDDSPDGTGNLADELAADDTRIHVLHRTSKEGLGAAYRAGFAWALERGYDRVVEMDADGSHHPEQLPSLLAVLDGADVAVGSRWVRDGRTEGWPLRRQLLSRGGSLYARILLGIPHRDITGGYRAYTAQALRTIDYATVTSAGYCFQVELLWRAHTRGLRIREVPITFTERVNGESKMHPGIIREAVTNIARWSFHGSLA